MHSENTFVTLTYAEEPSDLSLNKEHFRNFMKKLRKKYAPRTIRYYHCGEYGKDQDDLEAGHRQPGLGRPHYHAILFGIRFPDEEYLKKGPGGEPLFTSEILRAIWGLGHVSTGTVTLKSAGYVARYICDKITGDEQRQSEHYQKIRKETGELLSVLPEYTTMSLKPGIGEPWYQEFANDLWPWDECIIEGKRYPVPGYYLDLLERELPHLKEDIKSKRAKQFAKHAYDNTPERLATKEQVKLAQIQSLQRTL